MRRLIIGNAISMVAMLCLAASMRAKYIEKAYRLQLLETAFSMAAAVFFGSWAGLSTLAISLYRNIKVCRGTFSRRDVWLTSVLVVVVGCLVNNRGWVGILPIAAAVQLAWVNYCLKSLEEVRLGLLVNTLMWMIYAFLICDYASGIGETAAAAACLAAILRERQRAALPGRRRVLTVLRAFTAAHSA